MAGRGVDIKLGGNPEHLARRELAKLGLEPARRRTTSERCDEVLPDDGGAGRGRRASDVMEAGGLFICGTERHESRRIDNQLRGRAGRQGDPGESRFFLSAEDDLVRLFAGDRIYKILDRLGAVDDEGNEEPIEAGMLTKQIEKAQKKVEEQNFLIRKRVLEYDDVMNEQRRDRLRLPRRGPRGQGHRRAGPRGDRAASSSASSTSTRPATSSRTGTSTGCSSRSTTSFPVDARPEDLDAASRARAATARRSPTRSSTRRCELYDAREQEFGEELMRALERYLLLQIIDNRWREHLYDMDYLREGIHLRGFAQIEPIVAYKNEAFTLFTDLMNSIWADFARMIYHVEVEVEVDDPAAAQQAFGARRRLDPRAARQLLRRQRRRPGRRRDRRGRSRRRRRRRHRVRRGAEVDGGRSMPSSSSAWSTEDEQIGRNDPCWCGSGKKYKKCHGA